MSAELRNYTFTGATVDVNNAELTIIRQRLVIFLMNFAKEFIAQVCNKNTVWLFLTDFYVLRCSEN